MPAGNSPPLAPPDNKPWCLFVSGSRDLTWAHEDFVAEKLRPFKGLFTTLIHGMGEGRTTAIPGFDRVADLVAQRLGMHILAVPALWKVHGKAAGPIRNHLCAEILAAHGLCGYRCGFLGFSTGGPGTEGALKLVKSIKRVMDPPILIERFEVKL